MPTVTLSPSNTVTKDGYIYSSDPTNGRNFTASLFYVGNNTGSAAIARTFLQFDLGLIPNNAIINSATLRLVQSSTASATNTIGVYKITSSWDQTTVSWNVQPSIGASPVDQLSVGTASGAIYNFNVLSVVQEWVNGTASNYGFFLKVLNEGVESSHTFVSSESPSVSERPQLIIDYTIPSTGKKQAVIESNFASGKGTPSNTFTATIQTANAGDTYIIQVINAVNGNVTTSSPGWVKLGQSWNGFVCAAYFTKIASGGNDSPTFNTTGGNTTWYSQCLRLSNAKSVSQLFNNWSSGNTTQFSATGGSLSASKALMIGMTAVPSSGSWTPPLSANEQYDSYDSTTGTTVSSWAKYMHDKTTYSASDTTSTFSQSNMLMLALFEVQPKTNNAPTLSLTSPADNQTLSEGSAYLIEGTATDADVGDAVTVRYAINGGTARNITSAISDGVTPIPFSKVLTFQNGRLYDGATDVSGPLAENTTYTLSVYAVDDKGGTSTSYTRTFSVILNRPPTITLDTYETNRTGVSELETLDFSGTLSDPEGDTITLTASFNGSAPVTLKSAVASGTTFTYSVPVSALQNGDNTIVFTATDSKGASATKTLTVNKAGTFTPVNTAVVRYAITPPLGTTSEIATWVLRENGDLNVDGAVSIVGNADNESYTALTKTASVPLEDGSIIEDEFVGTVGAPGAKVTLRLTLTRTNSDSQQAVKKIMGGIG